MWKISFISSAICCLAASAMAQTTATINGSTFGMMEARQIGPGTMSGRISAIVGNEEDGKTIYVGTAGGGVWKTTNAGASFKPIFDKYCQSIGDIAIDPKNAKIIYVGTGESNMRNSVSIGDGLYKSTDGGDNWSRIGLDSTEHIAKIAINPQNPNQLFVAAPGPLWSDGTHRGLYQSDDGGKTWRKSLYINEKTGCADVAIDPKNPNVVYASTWEFRRLPYLFNSGGNGSGMYKSVDGGKTWKELTNGLPAKPFGRIAFALAPSAPNNLLAIVESSKTGLYISSDGGESWKPQSATLNVVSRPFYFSTLVIDPKDPKRVYRPAFSFSYSSDGGYSFAEATNEGGWVHSDHHALWINPNNTNQMYLGTDGGVYISLDRGATWMFVQSLPVGQFYHVAVDHQKPYRIYGGLQDNGSWVAPSALPGGVSNGDWKSIYGGDGFWTVPDVTDPEYAYAEYQGGNMARVHLPSFKSVEIKPQALPGDGKLRFNWNTPIVLGAKNPKNLYVGAQYLYKSTDKGANWTKISPDLTTNDKRKQEQENSGGLSMDVTSAENYTTIFTIAESPLDENLVFVGTDDGNLQITTDGGKNWTNVAANYAKAGIPAQTWISSIEPSRFDKNTLYATFDNHAYGDHKTYIGKSTDLGKTWTLFKSNEFSGFAHKIKEDLVKKELLFAGTEMGLFASIDGGENWFRMKNNIPWYALVRDIQIHPTTHDLIIGTHGRGIIVVDDITPMRTLNNEVAQKDVVLLPNATAPISDGPFGGASFPSTGGWTAPNAPAIAPIQYYLKDRISSGEVKIDILDNDGKLVMNIPSVGKRKGLNKVYWNQRIMPPKIAKGANPLNGSFAAPQVMPGNYQVRLTVGNKTYNQPLILTHDESNKQFSVADRQARHNLAMELYGTHENLAQLVDSITAEQNAIAGYLQQVKSAKVKQMLIEYQKEVNAIKAKLVPTEQTGFFADIRRLREDIHEVFVSVCGNEAKPSNLQVQRTAYLKGELKQVQTQFEQLKAANSAKVKKAILKEGIVLPNDVPVKPKSNG